MTTSEIERDMKFGQIRMLTTTPDDDIKGNIDALLNDLYIAWRRRRFQVTRWNEISIRAWRASGTETEMQKILKGETRAKLYVFQFMDAWVICRLLDIKYCLQNGLYYIKPNHDKTTKAAYININDLPHLLIPKGSNP